MRTKSYTIVYIFGILACLAPLISTGIFIVAMFVNMKFISFESDIMVNSTVTLGNAVKLAVFGNLTIFILAAYSFNLRSKFVMKITNSITILAIIGTVAMLVYFKKSYPNKFNRAVETAPYSADPLTMLAINNMALEGDVRKPREVIATTMSTMCNYFVYYELITAASMITISILFAISRRMKIESKAFKAPPITEMSKVGLNTVSLRTKRVVLGSA